MSAVSTTGYEGEIRDYLLGRLAKDRTVGSVNRVEPGGPIPPPILDWWIFEGRRYQGYGQCLALEWGRVAREARYLLATQNPRWRILERPEGEIDWLATATANAGSGHAGYVCRTSAIGLSEDEGTALEGWQGWTARRWRDYRESIGTPPGAPEQLPWEAGNLDPDERRLRRWAYVARRSRWPLLRSVVAESLRAVFEPQVLDRLPLPAEQSALFELVCIVRLLRTLYPRPRHIRWLDIQIGHNEITVPGVTVRFQFWVPTDEMLGTREFDGGLREGVERHGASTPRRVDALFLFDPPLGGFRGALLEAKSGRQEYRDTIFQLRCYRAAIKERFGGPFLVWGLVEHHPEQAPAWLAALESLARPQAAQRAPDDDLWLFTPADAIGYAALAVGIADSPSASLVWQPLGA